MVRAAGLAPFRHRSAPPAPPLPPGRELELPGRGRTFVRQLPAPPGAPTLFLLHGLGASADLNWWHCYETLGRRFGVVAIDHRGHGRGIRGGGFRLVDCADDVVAAADVLGIDRFIPVGYSMGGPIAQLVWRRHRQRVSGLVLCATSRDFRGTVVERLQFAVLAWLSLSARMVPWTPALKPLLRLLSVRRTAEPYGPWMLDELRRGDLVSVLEAAAQLGRFTSRDWIGDVDVPVGVVATSADSLVPVRRQVKLAMAVPTATIHVADGDHFLAHHERHSFVTALEEACELVARRAADAPEAGGRRPAG